MIKGKAPTAPDRGQMGGVELVFDRRDRLWHSPTAFINHFYYRTSVLGCQCGLVTVSQHSLQVGGKGRFFTLNLREMLDKKAEM